MCVRTSGAPTGAHPDGTSALLRGHRLSLAVLLGWMLWLHWEARSWEFPCLSPEPPESVPMGVWYPRPLGPALLRYAVCVCVSARGQRPHQETSVHRPHSLALPPLVHSWFLRRPLPCPCCCDLVLCFPSICSVPRPHHCVGLGDWTLTIRKATPCLLLSSATALSDPSPDAAGGSPAMLLPEAPSLALDILPIRKGSVSPALGTVRNAWPDSGQRGSAHACRLLREHLRPTGVAWL